MRPLIPLWMMHWRQRRVPGGTRGSLKCHGSWSFTIGTRYTNYAGRNANIGQWNHVGRPIEEVVQYQLDFILDLYEQFGVDREVALTLEEVKPFVALKEGLYSVLNGTYNETFFAGRTVDFWKSWSELNERARAANFTQPVLVLNGELDTNVPPSEAQLWSNHFAQANVTHTLEIVPCVMHALNCLSESDLTKLTVDDIGTTVHPSTIDAIADFILGYAASDGDDFTTSGVKDAYDIDLGCGSFCWYDHLVDVLAGSVDEKFFRPFFKHRDKEESHSLLHVSGLAVMPRTMSMSTRSTV